MLWNTILSNCSENPALWFDPSIHCVFYCPNAAHNTPNLLYTYIYLLMTQINRCHNGHFPLVNHIYTSICKELNNRSGCIHDPSGVGEAPGCSGIGEKVGVGRAMAAAWWARVISRAYTVVAREAAGCRLGPIGQRRHVCKRLGEQERESGEGCGWGRVLKNSLFLTANQKYCWT
jgi:hypothetical protein